MWATTYAIEHDEFNIVGVKMTRDEKTNAFLINDVFAHAAFLD